MRLTFYVKARCSLCDAARETIDDLVDELGERLALTVDEIDITTEPALYERHRREVPVVALDGEPAFSLRVDRDALRARLQAAEVRA